MGEFQKLPRELRIKASRMSNKITLINYLKRGIIFSFLNNNYNNELVSRPWNPEIIDKAIKRLNFRCSLIGILNNSISNFGNIVS